jgi:hypothetical protein
MKNKLLVLAVSVAIITNLVLYVPYFTHSKYEYVRHVKFGTQEESVLAGFTKEGISCGVTTLNDGRQRCEFSDPWRQYRMEFGRQGTLDRKEFTFRHRATLLGSLWKLLGLRVGSYD